MCPTTVFFIFLLGFSFIAAIAVAHFFSTTSFAVNFTRTYGGQASWSRNSWTTDIEGCSVTFVHTPRSKNTPSRLEVSLKGPFFAHAVFRKETQADRFAKDIGFNQEVQLFDMPFDNAVYVECEDRDFISHLLAGAEAKKYLQAILGTMTSLRIDGGRCVAVKTPCEPLSEVDSDQLMTVARAMAAFAQKIPLPGPGARSATPVTDECRRWTGFFTGFAVALSVAGVVLMIWGLAAFPPLTPGKLFLASLKASVPLAVLSVLYMFHQFKGLSVALRSFSLAAVFSIIGAVLVCWGGGMVLNGSQDVSPRTTHEVRVIGKHTTRSKNSTSYHMTVNAWDDRFPHYQFTVGHYDYQRINRGDPCTVRTGAGLFGFPWVAGHACHPAGS